jgi:hypothetical protein
MSSQYLKRLIYGDLADFLGEDVIEKLDNVDFDEGKHTILKYTPNRQEPDEGRRGG